jgi:8-oxo-dGTP pyrophosphatase MutT (NUDIX family)
MISEVSGGVPMKFLQFAALPYRIKNDAVEILLITTRTKGRWTVPKGWPIRHATPQQTAATEAYEEAGVYGAIGDRQIGRFRKRRLKKARRVRCNVRIYPLQVIELQEDWPEKHQRCRIWVAPGEAAKLVKKSGLRRAIRSFKR